MNSERLVSAVAVITLLGLAGNGHAQVGKSVGLIDVNSASVEQLTPLPHMTPEIIKSILKARPFESAIALHQHLLAQKLTAEQAGAFYAMAFVHINLNTATAKEIVLIPGAGKKMAHEFEEYRPWKSWAQFDKEISKYVGKEETARLAQYCFIPMNVNEAGETDLATIPGVKSEMVDQLTKGRPWKSVDDLKKVLAKTSGDQEAARIIRYLIVE